MVTSTLLASGHDPRQTIGSVNAAEFFVTVAETTTFVAMLGDLRRYLPIVAGLIVGGVIAAPIGAILCKKAAGALDFGRSGRADSISEYHQAAAAYRYPVRCG